MAADEYIVWVETTAWIPTVVKAKSHADARRVLLDAMKAGTVPEVTRQLDQYINFDGPDIDEADDWTVVKHDDFFSTPC